jgi:hypothetical protein
MFWMIVEFANNNIRAPSSVEDMNYCTVKVVRTPSLVSCMTWIHRLVDWSLVFSADTPLLLRSGTNVISQCRRACKSSICIKKIGRHNIMVHLAQHGFCVLRILQLKSLHIHVHYSCPNGRQVVLLRFLSNPIIICPVFEVMVCNFQNLADRCDTSLT